MTTPSEPEVVLVQSLGGVRKGDPGREGRQGERGKQGDHGQDGKTGPALMSKYQTVMLVLFVVLVGFLLAWRSEVNANSIRANGVQIAQNQYDECQIRNANINRLNALYTGLIKIERNNPFADTGKAAAATVQQRIDLYAANRLVLVNCGDRP